LELTAFWTMFLDGNIAAPPTMTVFSSALTGAVMVAERARTLKAAADRSAIRFDMDNLPIDEVTDGCRPVRVNDRGGGFQKSDCAVVGRVTGGLWGGFGE
jgi:hypothetical protein